MKMVIGLTGNYGMGKSFVLAVFRELGAAVIDADDVVAGLLLEEEVIHRVKKILGPGVEKEDGALDKCKIARIIFNNKELRQKLEALLHPLVIGSIERCLLKFSGKRQCVIVEVPLLFEGGYQGMFDRNITVFTTQKTAIERLMKGGISHSNALKRLKAQMPVKLKKEMADFCIDNNGTKQSTRKQVAQIYKQLFAEMT